MNNDRRKKAYEIRVAAADLAKGRVHLGHVANGDEHKFRRSVPESCDPNKVKSVPSYLATFTKGMPHDEATGLVKHPQDVQNFVKAIDSGDPRDFVDTGLGPEDYTDNNRPWKSHKTKAVCAPKGAPVRAWESQGAGNTFDLEGPDAQAVTMPPAPVVGSDELTAEMGEVYAQALLRDVPFTDFADGCGEVRFGCDPKCAPDTTVQEVIDRLNALDWFKPAECCGLSPAETGRRRGPFTGRTAFRGRTPGDDIGPYISQFLLVGNGGINGNDSERSPDQGLISYGALNIDQRVRYATPCDDHMIQWAEWLDVQEGADLRGLEQYQNTPSRRFITTPRDLATYVHYDALYEAYLNACLILLANGIPFDTGIPFQVADVVDHQQGFAHFGGPHILSLVTEVATRALKAVRYQKFNVHRRLRPEALAARLARHNELAVPEITSMVSDLQPLLDLVDQKNPADPDLPGGNYLLPMAFCEGSPMHPSYGAGHATVAGACVTILKAFFDHKHPLDVTGGDGPGKAYVADSNANGDSILVKLDVEDANGDLSVLTVEGELNKLASNISIGRDWAGVHYYSDYIESLRMGEQIAIGILEEQKLTYGENFSMTVPLFDGGAIRI